MALSTANFNYSCDLQSNETVRCSGQLCSALLSILMISLIIITVIGNGCVMYVIYHKSVLHTVTGFMMFNLAVTDFIVGIFNMPFSLAAFVASQWEFGLAVCKIVAFIHTQMSTASVVWLAAISIDRCYAICRPLKYYSVITTSKVKIFIALGYLISIVVALPPLFEYKSWGRYRYLGKMAFCWVSDCKARQYLISLMSFLLTSFLVIVICHALIYRSAKSNFRRIPRPTMADHNDQISNSTTSRTLMPWLSNFTQVQHNATVSKRLEIADKDKINKTTLIIVGTFFICWAPRTIIGILQLLTTQLDNYGMIELLFLWLSMINSTLNPIIYGFHNKVFRQEFRRAFSYRPHRIRPIVLPTSNRPSMQSFHRNTSN
ncbi:Trace amine-associated receptor 4 [Trichoplax sp. H2]|nr:Trace amine-associated receptor 4 [Trichoplax sp. H2]|eukprot:RDD46539.1 Trace amine-associated receptor 4 [Trichoplax sp. H2]